MALTLLRQVRAAGFQITAVLGDAEFGDNATLRRTLHRLQLPYALGISSTLTVFRGTPRVAVPPTRPGRSRPRTRLQLVDDRRPEAVRAIAAHVARARVATRVVAQRRESSLGGALRRAARDPGPRLARPSARARGLAALRARPRRHAARSRPISSPAGDRVAARLGPVGASSLGDRTAILGAERRTRPRSLRGPLVCRVASSRRAHRVGLRLVARHAAAHRRLCRAARRARGDHRNSHRSFLRDAAALPTDHAETGGNQASDRTSST